MAKEQKMHAEPAVVHCALHDSICPVVDSHVARPICLVVVLEPEMVQYDGSDLSCFMPSIDFESKPERIRSSRGRSVRF